MNKLSIAALALLLSAPLSFSMAQNYTPTPGLSDVHNSIYGDMPQTHDVGAIVHELNNNGLSHQATRAGSVNNSSAYQDYYNPRA